MRLRPAGNFMKLRRSSPRRDYYTAAAPGEIFERGSGDSAWRWQCDALSGLGDLFGNPRLLLFNALQTIRHSSPLDISEPSEFGPVFRLARSDDGARGRQIAFQSSKLAP